MKNRIASVAMLLVSVATTNAFGAGIVGGLFGGDFGSMMGKSMGQSESIEASIKKTVDAINAKGPQMLDESTRMDFVTFGPPRTVTYHHTMVNFYLKDVNRAVFDGEFTNNTRAKVCANQGIKQMFLNNVSFVYEYKTKDGQRIGPVLVNRSHCGI